METKTKPSRRPKATGTLQQRGAGKWRLRVKVGVAVGGPRELDRRLDAGRAAVATFPNDVADLEREAQRLGWVAVASD